MLPGCKQFDGIEAQSMRDLDIRMALRAWLPGQMVSSEPLLVVEEVPICLGHTRVDLVTVSERLHGFEIKSQLDTLSRLQSQLADYSRVFDEVTLVIGFKHLMGVINELPSWCGIVLAHRDQGEVRLEPFRSGGPNYHRDPLCLAQLLWREEALEVLTRYGHDRGVRGKARAVLWERLAERLALEDLAEEVRNAMKARGDTWRASQRGLAKARPAARRKRRRRRAKASR